MSSVFAASSIDFCSLLSSLTFQDLVSWLCWALKRFSPDKQIKNTKSQEQQWGGLVITRAITTASTKTIVPSQTTSVFLHTSTSVMTFVYCILYIYVYIHVRIYIYIFLFQHAYCNRPEEILCQSNWYAHACLNLTALPLRGKAHMIIVSEQIILPSLHSCRNRTKGSLQGKLTLSMHTNQQCCNLYFLAWIYCVIFEHRDF